MTNNGKIIFISYLACRRFSRSPSGFVFFMTKGIYWDLQLEITDCRILKILKKSIFWGCLMQNAQAYSTAHCACLQRGSVQRKSYCSALNSIQVYINVLCIRLQYSLMIYICISRSVHSILYSVQAYITVHVYICMYVCIHVYMYTCMYICMSTVQHSTVYRSSKIHKCIAV